MTRQPISSRPPVQTLREKDRTRGTTPAERHAAGSAAFAALRALRAARAAKEAGE